MIRDLLRDLLQNGGFWEWAIAITFAGTALIIFGYTIYVIVIVAMYAIDAARDFLMALINYAFVGLGIIIATMVLIVTAHFVVDLTSGLREQMAQRKRIRLNLANSQFPLFDTFIHVQLIEQGSHHPVDYMTAKLLAEDYQNTRGRFPRLEDFEHSTHYEDFKHYRLPRLILRNRQFFNQFFTRLYSAYEEARAPVLRAWVHEAIRKHYRERTRFASMRRLANTVSYVLSLGRFEIGIRAHEVWQTVDPKTFPMTLPVFLQLCALEYFISPPERFRPIASNTPEPPKQIHAPPVEESIIEDPHIIDVEPEVKDEDKTTEPSPSLSDQALEVERSCEQILHHDHEDWKHPEKLLEDVFQSLTAILPHHPSPDSIHSLIALVCTYKERLRGFEEDFLEEMNRPRDPDEGWGTMWAKMAIAEFPTNFMTMEAAHQFKRICCRHYLAEEPSQKATPVPSTPTSESSPQSTPTEGIAEPLSQETFDALEFPQTITPPPSEDASLPDEASSEKPSVNDPDLFYKMGF